MQTWTKTTTLSVALFFNEATYFAFKLSCSPRRVKLNAKFLEYFNINTIELICAYEIVFAFGRQYDIYAKFVLIILKVYVKDMVP